MEVLSLPVTFLLVCNYFQIIKKRKRKSIQKGITFMPHGHVDDREPWHHLQGHVWSQPMGWGHRAPLSAGLGRTGSVGVGLSCRGLEVRGRP